MNPEKTPPLPEPDTDPAFFSHDRALLSWKAPEFMPHHRSKTWLIGAVLFVLGLIVYGILTQSATTAIVFLLLGGVYFLTQNQKPRPIDIHLTQLGIRAHKTFYPYNTIRSFWIVYDPPFVQTLNFDTTKRAFSHVTLQLGVQDPISVHDLLSKKVPEAEGREESFSEVLVRLFRL